MRELRSAGVPTATIAGAAARAWGLTPSVTNRKKIAARLRTRLTRDGVTRRNEEVSASSPDSSTPGLQSVRDREQKENDMAERLVKRITETYIVVPDDEADDGPVGELDDVGDYEDEEEERKPRRRPAPRPRRR